MTATRFESDTRSPLASTQDDVVRIRLRYPDLDTFYARFSPNVTRGGIFLATRQLRPVGEILRFEVLLKHLTTPLLSGEGRVSWIKEYNAAEPHKPYGMGVQFVHVDPQTRPTLDQLLARKAPTRPARALSGQPSNDQRRTEPRLMSEETTEISLDDGSLRRLLDRARLLSGRTDDVEILLVQEPQEAPVTLDQALSDLPRVLSGRRTTTSVRVVADEPDPEKT